MPEPDIQSPAGPGTAAAQAADLALLVEAAGAAGQIALRHFGHAPQAWEKPDGAGPVSEADLEVDRFLRKELTAARPDTGWLSEETTDSAARLAHESVFVVDPIDGTRAFLAGHADWSISLALVRGGEVAAAVVHLPVHQVTFAATADGPALRNGAPVHVAPRSRLEGASVLTKKRFLAPGYWRGAVPAVVPQLRSSIAFRLALVAEGRFDAMMTLAPCWEWDVAAGVLIAARAGAQVLTPAGQAPRFNRPHPRLPGLIAAPPALCSPLLAALAPEGGANGARSV